MSVLTPPCTRGSSLAGSVPSRRRRRFDREALAGYLFVLPSTVHFLVFTVYLMVSSLVMSTWVWDLLTPHHERGLYNYRTLLFHDPLFWTAWRHTLLYALMTIPTGMALGLLLALAVNTRLRGIAVFRAAYFLPVVVPVVATAIIFRWLYDPDFGLINWFLGLFGIPHHAWLDSSSTALPSIAAMSVWQSLGWNMTFFLVGLQSIPRELYEVSSIDGAGRWVQFRHVTWPLLTPMTFFILVTSTIGNLQGAFDQVYLLSKATGGPGYSTYTNAFYLYSQAFRYFHYGYAAAYAWVIFVVIAVFTFLQFRFLSKRINYGVN